MKTTISTENDIKYNCIELSLYNTLDDFVIESSKYEKIICINLT